MQLHNSAHERAKMVPSVDGDALLIGMAFVLPAMGLLDLTLFVLGVARQGRRSQMLSRALFGLLVANRGFRIKLVDRDENVRIPNV